MTCFIQAPNGFTNINTDQNISLEPDNPKLSNSNIEILTPKNKTYCNPMNEYYQATYGFENDEDGTLIPADFDIFISTSCDGQIIDELDGHKKIYRCYDNNEEGAIALQQIFENGGFSNQTYGTVEYWWRGTTVSRQTTMRFNWGYDINDMALDFKVDNGKWAYHDGSSWKDLTGIPDPIANQWYHLKFDFRCSGAQAYKSLGENEFEVFINGTSGGVHEFRQSATKIIMVMPSYTEWGAYYGNYAYINAIGYSWDPNYNIGDNLNEGLLLSYECNENLEWISYSLDGQANRTILGNITISMPEYGPHRIQMFGNNSLGTIYQSDVKHFLIIKNPGSFNLYSTAKAPDIDGSFNLYWDESTGADNYSVFFSKNFITQIDETCNEIAQEIQTTIYPVSVLLNGDFYYVVIAHNEMGDTLSNCIHINVQIPPSNGDEGNNDDNDDKKGKKTESPNILVPTLILVGLASTITIISVATIILKKRGYFRK